MTKHTVMLAAIRNTLNSRRTMVSGWFFTRTGTTTLANWAFRKYPCFMQELGVRQ